MHGFLRRYRAILDNDAVPEIIKKRVERLGISLFRRLFQARHTRLELYRVRSIGGLSMDLWLDWQDYTDAGYIFQRVWSQPLASFMAAVLRPGDCAADIGANVGYFTLLMSKLVGNGRIMAVEPLSRNRHVLEKNIRENGATNVIIEGVAAASAPGETVLRHRYLNSGSPSTLGYFGTRDPVVDIYMSQETVRCKTVPAMFEEHGLGRCRIVKIDVQGAEYDIVESMGGLLRERRVDYLIVEDNPAAYAGRDIRDLAQAAGYAVFGLARDGSLLPAGDGERDIVFARRVPEER